MTDLTPQRETPHRHRCCCVITGDGSGWDACGAMVENPDQPLCDECYQAGHHRLQKVRHG